MNTQNTTPDHYVCKKCKAKGVKLWRKAYTDIPFCLVCVEQEVSPGAPIVLDDKGFSAEHKSDQIKGFLPAVPVGSSKGYYWGYTSVPEAGVLWWQNLPNRTPTP